MFANNLFLSSNEETETLVGTSFTANDTTDEFGWSVAIARDSIYAVIGAPNDDTTLTDQGSAYVFIRSNNTWTQQAKLVASDPGGADNFGMKVVINATGDTIAIGAPGDDTGTLSNHGSVYVFVRNGTSWSQQAKLNAPDWWELSYFGRSLAISDDGNTLAIGSQWTNYGTTTNVGACYIFTRSGTNWSQQTKFVPTSLNYANAGADVDLSQDGNTVLIGAPGGGGGGGGRAYTYIRSGSTWTSQYTLLPSAGGNLMGGAVAISGDGKRCLVGSPGSGKVFVYDSGTEVAVIAGTGSFGGQLDTTTDGSTALVGRNTAGNPVQVFTSVTPSTWSQTQLLSFTGVDGWAPRFDGLGVFLLIGTAGGNYVRDYRRTII